MYWLLLYDLVDDYLERRGALRERHLALARMAEARGELVLAGALADPVDGAALVFRTDDVAVVEAFVAADPYVKDGLVRSWWIRPWNVVVGSEATPASASAAARSATGGTRSSIDDEDEEDSIDDSASASDSVDAADAADAAARRRDAPLRAARTVSSEPPGRWEF